VEWAFIFLPILYHGGYGVYIWLRGFIGAAIISQVRLFNMHPTGSMHAKERLRAVMGHEGIEDCANARNCVKACPKEIPLTESLAEINRQAWKQALLGWIIG